MAGLLHEARDALKRWAKAPGVTALTLLSMALGIGANTASFSVLNALLLKPLPVRDAERIVIVREDRRGLRNVLLTTRAWEQLQETETVFTKHGAYSVRTVDLARPGEPSTQAQALIVSGSYFDALDLRPAVGRLIAVEDDRDGAVPVAVVSHRFWERVLGADRDLAGHLIHVFGQPVTIVGVADRSFFGLDVGRGFDVALSIESYYQLYDHQPNARQVTFWLNIIGRLAPGQSVEQAQAAIRVLQASIAESSLPSPQARPSYLKNPWTLAPANAIEMPGRVMFASPLLIVAGVVGIVLLISCLNLANLLLAQGTARQPEFVLRAALGASRVQLATSAFVEAVLLALGGSLLGAVVAANASRAIVALVSTSQNPVYLDVSSDVRVAMFSAAVALATALLCGILPAWKSGRVNPIDALRSPRQLVRGSRRTLGMAHALLAAQVAMTFAIAFVAVTFSRSFTLLVNEPVGFDHGHVFIVDVGFPRGQVAEEERRAVLLSELRDSLAAVPDVSNASFSFSAPFGTGGYTSTVSIPGYASDLDPGPQILYNIVDVNYFDTLGVVLVGGRRFSAEDAGRDVAIVSTAFSRSAFGTEGALGRTLRFSPGGTTREFEIVGIAADTKAGSLRQSPPMIYVPWAPGVRSLSGAHLGFVIRTRAYGVAPDRALVDAVHRLAPESSVAVRSIDVAARESVVRERALAWVSAVFSGLALLLAGMGTYGLLAYYVTRRRSEIGIRIAIGARPSRVLALLVGQLLVVVGVGMLAGIVLSLGVSRVVRALLYEISPADPVGFAITAGIIAVVSAAAALLPGRRAVRIDPAMSLRDQ